MTALRSAKPTPSALRKAGMIFGLDLASLFDKEEGDDEAYSDFAPGVEFEKTTKGKGGGLYMRPQPVTGETTRLKFLPREAQIMSPSEISINLSAPPIQKPEEQEEEKKEEYTVADKLVAKQKEEIEALKAEKDICRAPAGALQISDGLSSTDIRMQIFGPWLNKKVSSLARMLREALV